MASSTLRQSIADRRAKQGDKGFTLIELLVVVLIIGILAAIAIPVFLGQQNSAKDGAAKSDIGNIELALVGYYTVSIIHIWSWPRLLKYRSRWLPSSRNKNLTTL